MVDSTTSSLWRWIVGQFYIPLPQSGRNFVYLFDTPSQSQLISCYYPENKCQKIKTNRHLRIVHDGVPNDGLIFHHDQTCFCLLSYTVKLSFMIKSSERTKIIVNVIINSCANVLVDLKPLSTGTEEARLGNLCPWFMYTTKDVSLK